MIANYWNQESGDYAASPFQQAGTLKSTSLSGSSPAAGDNEMMYAGGTQGFYGTDAGKMTSGGFMDNMQQPQQPTQHTKNPWESVAGDNKEYNNYGPWTSPDSGGGWWSGGRPGAGSWMEALAAPSATPLKSGTPSPVVGDMVPGAQRQIPAQSPKMADPAPAPMSHWDTPYAGRYPIVNQMYSQYLDRDSEEGGWQGWESTIDEWFKQGMNGDQINARLAQEFQNSTEYRQRMGMGAAPSYQAPAVVAPTNPWIQPDVGTPRYGGGGGRLMNKLL